MSEENAKVARGVPRAERGDRDGVRYDVVEKPVAESKIGYLPEGAPLYGEMTPAGFLEFIAEEEAKQAIEPPVPGRLAAV